MGEFGVTQTFTTGTLIWTNAALKAGTNLNLVGAPGVGKYVFPVALYMLSVYGGSNPWTNNPSLFMDWNNAAIVLTSMGFSGWTNTQNFVHLLDYGWAVNANDVLINNEALELAISVALLGNAAGDNTVKVLLHYKIISF